MFEHIEKKKITLNISLKIKRKYKISIWFLQNKVYKRIQVSQQNVPKETV